MVLHSKSNFCFTGKIKGGGFGEGTKIYKMPSITRPFNFYDNSMRDSFLSPSYMKENKIQRS